MRPIRRTPPPRAAGQPSLADRMRDRGIRMTAQRRLLAELLDNAREHLDAESVYRLAQRRDATIHRATVYRTLKLLKRQGLVDELDLMHVAGERHYYEVRPSVFHIHLVCTACGGVHEPGGRFWEELKEKVRRETGFRAEVMRLEMGGLCESCQNDPIPRGV